MPEETFVYKCPCCENGSIVLKLDPTQGWVEVLHANDRLTSFRHLPVISDDWGKTVVSQLAKIKDSADGF